VKVVSNAGPLIALGKLGRLDILRKLYGTVLVAEEVYEEVVTSGVAYGAPDAYLIREYFSEGAFEKRQVEIVELGREARIEDGERATIELALREGAEFVLIDDAVARGVAEKHGLRVKGTLGVLLEAVRKGILTMDEGIILIHQIKRRRDIWIRDSLCDLALEGLRRLK